MRHTKRVDETRLIASPANWLMDPYIAAIVVCCWLGPIINQAYYNGPSVVNDKFAVYYNEPLTPFWRALYSMDLLTTRSPAAAAAAAAAAAHNTTTRQQKNN